MIEIPGLTFLEFSRQAAEELNRTHEIGLMPPVARGVGCRAPVSRIPIREVIERIVIPSAFPARAEGLLKRPEDAPQLPQEKLEELQQGHLANLRAMAESGDLIIAGPVEDGGALRGILIFRTQDAGRIEELVARDPSIQAGRLELELHPWRVPRGSWVAKNQRLGQ